MSTHEKRHVAYTKGVYYFIIYSAICFIMSHATFFSIRSVLYLLVGFALSGAVSLFFVSIQHKIEKGLNPNFWILNILIDAIGYLIFTKVLFTIFFG